MMSIETLTEDQDQPPLSQIWCRDNNLPRRRDAW